MSQPKYPGNLVVAQAANRLAEAANSPDHEFWPVNVNMLGEGVFDWTRVLGHRQVTDIFYWHLRRITAVVSSRLISALRLMQ